MKRQLQLVILFAFSFFVVGGSFGDVIDKSKVVWKDTSDAGLLGAKRLIHSADIEGEKSRFSVRRSYLEFFPSARGRILGWHLYVMSKNRRMKDSLDEPSLGFIFSKTSQGQYQLESISLNAPDKQKIGSVRKENVTLTIGYKVKVCSLGSDDFKFVIDQNTIKHMGLSAIDILKFKTFSAQYKKSDGKLTKVSYDISELKQVLAIMKDNAKSAFSEDVEFKFMAGSGLSQDKPRDTKTGKVAK